MRHPSHEQLYNWKAWRLFWDSLLPIYFSGQCHISSESKTKGVSLETLTDSIVHRDSPSRSLYGDQMYLAVHLNNCVSVPSGLWLSYGNAVVQSHAFPEMSHIQWWLNSSLSNHCPDWLKRGQPLVQISSRHRWINLPADSARVACMTVSCLTLWGPHSFSPSHWWPLTTVLLLVLIWCCLPGEPQIPHPMRSERKY